MAAPGCLLRAPRATFLVSLPNLPLPYRPTPPLSPGWPQIVKCRGTVGDLAGFTKETAFWLRSWWLSNITAADPGRPAATSAADMTVFIVESWTPPVNGSLVRVIHIYSNAPTVGLELNGKPAGSNQSMPFFGAVSYTVPYTPGNLTAVAYDRHGRRAATFTRSSAGKPAQLRMSIDAPSPETGTGSALVADGEDAAMLRVEVLDSEGRRCPLATTNVTFRVVEGAAAVWGTHNGDPACHVPPHAAWHPAYHGLVRAIVRSTADEATPAAHRRRLREIDVDGIDVADPDVAGGKPQDIVVEATAPGLPPVRVTIPVTTDLGQLPVNVAARFGAMAPVLKA